MTKQILLFTSTFLFVFLWNANIIAQDKTRNYIIKTTLLDQTMGLSGNAVNCITQDRYGFMWIGTDEGLNKYDGFEIEIYRHTQNDSNSINSNQILALQADSEGKIWIGTHRGLNYYDPQLDKIFQVNLINANNESIQIIPVTHIHIIDNT